MHLRAIDCLLLLCIGFAIFCPVASAQDTLTKDAADATPQRLVLESIGIAPQSYWSSDGLLIVRCGVKNTSSLPAEGFLEGRAVGNLSHADRRRIAIEPNSSQNFEFQIRLPVPLPESKVDIEVSLFAIRDGREVLVVNGNEPATRTLSFWRQEKNRFVTAVAMGREPVPPLDWRLETAKPFATSELAVASRIDGELSRNCIAFEAIPLPLNAVDWKYIDTLIISEPNVLKDAASVSVLRSFLFGGGRIWVMLDDIDTQATDGLLTENQQCTTIDTIEIDRFVVETTKQSMALADRTVALNDRVRFKKVMQQGGTASHSIDGWPVAIVMPIGRGELILTTLASSAWIEPRSTQWSADPNFQSEFQLRRWARGIVDMVHSKRATPLINLKEISYPIERIGNPIVPRSLVAGILALFCVSLLGFGLWRIWVGELKWIGLVSPGLALAASVPLILVAWLQKSEIPAMVSLFQLVQYESPSGGAIRESAAVYRDASGPMELRGNSGGFVVPDPGIDSGITTITTDDFQTWRMSNVAWPTGAWKYTSETTLSDASMVARGELTPEGLNIQIPKGLPSRLKDPVLSYTAGTSTLGKPLGDERVLIDGEYPAEGERWTLDSIVDDEQRRRSAIYAKMLQSSDRLQIPTRTFFGWTDLFSTGPQWDVPIERRGVALVAMPVVIATPTLGSQVRIPYTLIEVRNANLGISSPIYMESVGRWVSQSSNPTESSFEFILPEEAVPLEVASIDIHWDVQAPRRQVQLSCISQSESNPIEVVALNEPSLPWQQTITDPRILKDFEDGRLVLKVQVSEDREVGSSTPWRIKHLRISVTGKTLPRNQLVKPASP